VTTYPDESVDRSSVDSLSIALSVLGIAAAAVGLAYFPALLGPGGFLLALVAVLASDYARGFAAAAAAFTALAWLGGMTIAIFTHHSLF
jgi:hypothetical protein